jgi:serine/threonine protein kinase
VRLIDVATRISPETNQDTDFEPESTEGASSTSGFIYLVFEYIEHDLSGLLDQKVPLSLPVIRCLTKQLLSALVYLHEQNICHRDLKCSNLLVTNGLHLKLADFGLARELTEGNGMQETKYTTNVITIWYRPPELLLGSTKYSFPVDMWSVGCIVLELLLSKAPFPGRSEMDQLKLIFEVCGTPTSENWPDYAKIPKVSEVLDKFEHKPPAVLEFCTKRGIDQQGAQLVERLLILDPNRRYTASQALTSSFVAGALAPHELPPLAVQAHMHEFETKRARKSAKAADQAQSQPPLQQSSAKKAEGGVEVVSRSNEVVVVVAPAAAASRHSSSSASSVAPPAAARHSSSTASVVAVPPSHPPIVLPASSSSHKDEDRGRKRDRRSPDHRRRRRSRSTGHRKSSSVRARDASRRSRSRSRSRSPSSRRGGGADEDSPSRDRSSPAPARELDGRTGEERRHARKRSNSSHRRSHSRRRSRSPSRGRRR